MTKKTTGAWFTKVERDQQEVRITHDVQKHGLLKKKFGDQTFQEKANLTVLMWTEGKRSHTENEIEVLNKC